MNKSILLVLSLALAVACGKKKHLLKTIISQVEVKQQQKLLIQHRMIQNVVKGKFDTVELGATLDQAFKKRRRSSGCKMCIMSQNNR